MLFLNLFLACHLGPNLKKVETFAECPTEPLQTGRLNDYYPMLLAGERAEVEGHSHDHHGHDKETGVLVLEEGLRALLLRGWLTEQAQHTIDIQYFIFSADNVGLVSTAALVAAAERGVHIRLIVDDVLAHGDEEILRDVNMHPNIEVKVFNPNINIGKHWTEKSRNLLTDFEAINQRMHHKSLIVDGRVVVTGGRNVGDEYYDLNDVYNFRDRDVALFGGVASVVQESFEFFWADNHSVPIHHLLEGSSLNEAQQTWLNLRNYACTPKNFLPAFRQQIDEMGSFLEQQIQDKTLVWSDYVQFVSDSPWKNEQDGFGGGSTTTRELIGLLEQAEQRIWIQTPYLVLSQLGLSALKAARDRGVEVKILTNSLAATDNYPAFAGYKKIRSDLEAMGVSVYEIRPDAPAVRALNKTGIPTKMDADVGLHAKSMLIDSHIAVVGTFNMDPRSANLNTESFVVVRDSQINQQMSEYFQREMESENAWPAHRRNEREASMLRRFVTWISRLVPSVLL